MDFRSHMLRDTYAVEMLLAGVPLEKVSALLTYESVAMTERYYASWTRSRKEQLEGESILRQTLDHHRNRPPSARERVRRAAA